MTTLRVRWAAGAGDRPGPGEALARLDLVRRPVDPRLPGRPPAAPNRTAREGGGRSAPPIVVSGGEARMGVPRPTDLRLASHRIVLSVETADGRKLEATHGHGLKAPQIDADAPADLRDALVRAWREGAPAGRPVEDFGPDVAKYRAEVRRRIDAGEPTDLARVAELMGWNGRTVRRHVQRAGFDDWPTFVAFCRLRR